MIGATCLVTFLVLAKFFMNKQLSFLHICIGLSGALILSIISSFYGSILFTLVYAALAGAYMYWFVPRLPKKRLFYLASVIAICSYVLNIAYLASDLLIIANLVLFGQTVFIILITVIFFERIVDMVYAVSYKSVTDGLTGLYYKSFFVKKVDDAVRSGQPAAVIFCDIDNFKRVNDTQGHYVGDQILKLVARIMKEVCQDIGIAGRYGGEEIVGLITDSNADASVIAERFRSRVQAESGSIFPVTVSVGLSSSNEQTESGESLIRKADEALYIAKSTGKNRVVQAEEARSLQQHESVPLEAVIFEKKDQELGAISEPQNRDRVQKGFEEEKTVATTMSDADPNMEADNEFEDEEPAEDIISDNEQNIVEQESQEDPVSNIQERERVNLPPDIINPFKSKKTS
ncbi:GGDEF domain-containing protein [Paenibacillus campinasensis]|nr:GGDEF domain-containing protein [Paenibacillus campinasensis]